MKTAELVATLRLSKPELKRILEEVRNRRETCGDQGRRKDPRWWFGKALSITLPDERDRAKSLAVLGMDLSRTGIGLLSGSFIYPDTPIVVMLPSRTGDDVQHVEGVARSCSHFFTRWHRVGIQFESPLDPSAFVEVEAA